MGPVARGLGRVLTACNLAAGAMTVLLTLLICLDVLSRLLFSVPLLGVPEMVKVGIICIVWLQIGYTLRIGKHLRSDSLVGYLPGWLQRALEILNALIGILLLAAIAQYGWAQTVKSWTGGVFEGEKPVRIPVWPIWLILTAGSGLTAAEYALQALGLIVGRSPRAD